MKFIEITDLKSANDLRQLYIESFIPDERIEFDQLFSGVFKDFRMVCLYNDFGSLVGMMHYIVKENFIHLNYFAISPKFRGQGFGSMCLSWLKESYNNKPIVVDIEEEDEHADNNDYVRKKEILWQKWTNPRRVYFSLEWSFYDIYAHRHHKFRWIYETHNSHIPYNH